MSAHETTNAEAIELTIEPRRHDLGGFEVGRVLPFARRRHVGPVVFFDHMGPADFPPGKGVDVRPHPHIGLATVTYLFDGEMTHKDSLGYDQVIRPGDVNWMTAGRGIVHSERTGEAARAAGQHMHGIQTWVALPEDAEETAPEFHHHPKAALPVISGEGFEMRLIAGRLFGETSPVKTFSDMFYAGVEAREGARIPLPSDHEERAIYVVSGALSCGAQTISAGHMAVFRPGSDISLTATADTRAMALGGAPLGERHIWWNFVSSSRERIEQAKTDWLNSAEAEWEETPFLLPPGEREYIPLPD